MSVTIEVTQDKATPAIEKLKKRLTPQRLASAAGPACARLVQRHFRGLGTNKRGWPSTHFWARAARATFWSREPEGVMVSVNQIGVRQRWLGGQIKPVNARALTIPVSPVAYGHRASEFPGLFLLKTKKGAYLAQRGVEGARAEKISAKLRKTLIHSMGGNANRRQRARLNILFKLSSGVDQAPDPNVLPAMTELSATATQAIKEAIAR